MEYCFLSGLFIGLILTGGFFWNSFVSLCPPNTALIIYRGNRFKVVLDGYTVHWPIIEQVQKLSLAPLSINLFLEDLTTKDGSVTLTGLATIRISTETGVVDTAVQKLSGNTPSDTQLLGREILEKHTRTVLSELSMQELNHSRRSWSDQIAENSREDFRSVGLNVETFIIQGISLVANGSAQAKPN